MTREDVGQVALATILIAVAGWVDAAGFLRVGHLFVSFMSGDTTKFAIAAVHVKPSSTAWTGRVVGLFVLGAASGRMIGHMAPTWRQPAVLALEAALLAAAAGLAPVGEASVVPMVLAMGVQNSVVHRAGETKASLTYVTGTLVNFAEQLVDALWGEPKARWAWAPYLCFWLGLVAGAMGGALAYRAFGLHALLAPAGLLLLLSAASLYRSAPAAVRTPGSNQASQRSEPP